MFKDILLIIAAIIGGFMISVTSNNLGELGNKIMLLVGRIIILSVVIILLYRVFFEKRIKSKNEKE